MSGDYDVVVVGAGAAGVCCAGELTVRGRRVALIAETPEVAWNFRPKRIGASAAHLQYPVSMSSWTGGYWYRLARELDVPARFVISGELEILFRGWEKPKQLTLGVSAAAIADLFEMIAPVPLGDIRDELLAIMAEALNADWRELFALSDVPLAAWLEERKVSPMLQALIFVLCANMWITTVERAAANASVTGLFAYMRLLVCSEGFCASVLPNAHDGLFVPMARAVEARGGTVFRGRRVDRVLVENDRAVGAVLADGTEVRGRAVAIATRNTRVPKILPDAPESVSAAAVYSETLAHVDARVYQLLDDPVLTYKGFTMVADENGDTCGWYYPIHDLAPWAVEAGKQLLVTQYCLGDEAYEKAGGIGPVTDRMIALNEELAPGITKATATVETGAFKQCWMEYLAHGPKMPRSLDEIGGLYFVGDGAAPVVGVGVDAAAGSGIEGARFLAGVR